MKFSELARGVYELCLDGGTLITEATGGFGKTVAVLTVSCLRPKRAGAKVVYTCRTKR